MGEDESCPLPGPRGGGGIKDGICLRNYDGYVFISQRLSPGAGQNLDSGGVMH